jgi:hypothetical protein
MGALVRLTIAVVLALCAGRAMAQGLQFGALDAFLERLHVVEIIGHRPELVVRGDIAADDASRRLEVEVVCETNERWVAVRDAALATQDLYPADADFCDGLTTRLQRWSPR